MHQNTFLNVPKREIFNRSDFPDFSTIKSLHVGGFGVKFKKNLNIFRGAFWGAKILTRGPEMHQNTFFTHSRRQKLSF
jgi:hypothetical protein